MAGDGNQRTLEPPGHVLDKARLATASRAFQDDGQMRGVRGFEQADFIIDRQVIRLFSDSVFFDGAFGHGFLGYFLWFDTMNLSTQRTSAKTACVRTRSGSDGIIEAPFNDQRVF